MDNSKYNLIFSGEFIDDTNKEESFKKISDAFNADLEKVKKLFSRKKAVIKREASKQTCLKMQEMILFAGAKCHIEKVYSENSDDEFILFDEPSE